MAGEFLVFQHVPHEPPGLLFQAAEKNGIKLDVVELWKPYEIPKVGQHAGLMIMGGPMGVNDGPDKFPSKKDELTYILSVEGRIPMFGFCLGSQLLAHAFGGRVYPNKRNGKIVKEIGFSKVSLTREGSEDPIFEGFTSPIKVLQWHGDAFGLPKGARLLATSPDCRNQAFRLGNNIYGTLFHNEFTPDMVRHLIDVDREWIHKDFELDEESLIRQAEANNTLMRIQCQRLFDNFLALPSLAA